MLKPGCGYSDLPGHNIVTYNGYNGDFFLLSMTSTKMQGQKKDKEKKKTTQEP